MARGKYEGSAADERKDAAARKKAGMTQAQWERSARDRAMDRAGQKKLNQAARRKR